MMLQLHRVPLFAATSEAVSRRLVDGASLLELGRSESLLEEGVPADAFFVVLGGSIKIVHRLDDGRERLVHVVEKGGTVGLAAMFRQQTYPASAMAQKAALVLRVSKEAMIAAVREDSDFALSLLEILALRNRMFVKKLGSHGSPSFQRLSQFLLHRSAMACNDTFNLGLSREEMANMLGTVRETLSRSLARLIHEGVIGVNGRILTILNRPQLELFARGTGMEKTEAIGGRPPLK